MYHDIRDQGTVKLAVSAVVLNRVNDDRFPDSVQVVLQAQTRNPGETEPLSPIRNKCQFSWYCDGKSDEVKDEKTYQKILDFARLIMHNDIQFVDITDGATHYHADYVKPDCTNSPRRERQRLVTTSFIVGRKNEYILLRPSSYQSRTNDV